MAIAIVLSRQYTNLGVRSLDQLLPAPDASVTLRKEASTSVSSTDDGILGCWYMQCMPVYRF
jgi:hypothetical protein